MLKNFLVLRKKRNMADCHISLLRFFDLLLRLLIFKKLCPMSAISATGIIESYSQFCI